jgi:hypothetical protein
MLHEQMTPWTSAYSAATAPEHPDSPIAMMAYRSRAVVAPKEQELDLLLRNAQARNRTERLSGLLIYDQGHYFQWLEGPAEALARVWASISRDPRHTDIQVLRQQGLPKRFFGAWDMRLARRKRGRLDTALSVLETPEDLLKRVRVQPSGLGQGAWDDIFADVVVPVLRNKHLAPHPMPRRATAIWHAALDAPEELAGLLLAVDQLATVAYMNSLVDQGASLETLFQEVFEPAARFLGGLRNEDQRTDIEIGLGLGRLQIEVRRLSASFEHPLYAIRPGHTVLIAPEPGESHGLGAAMASELFWRDGWDVSCEFPSSDADLGELLKNRWFDVLELSSSSALRRDHRLAAIGVTIRAAHEASLNPALMVIVDGRAFIERPQAYLDIGADAGCVTVVEAVPAAHRLLSGVTQPATAASSKDRARERAARKAAAATGSLRLFERQFRSTVF